MPLVKEIAAVIEEIAPRQLAEEWDNVGTLVDCGGPVDGILVSLDITGEVVQEAQALDCQLIVAHHPVIMRPLRALDSTDVVYAMARAGISAICVHTNLDAAPGGVNDILAALFSLREAEVFAGFGRVGNLAKAKTATDLAKQCVKKFGTPVRVADGGRAVKRLAVIGGKGGRYVPEARAAGADALLTGEGDHHDALDAKQAGMSLVVAGHFATEFPVVPVLAGGLSRQFPDIRVQISRRNKDPFIYLP